jgi:hypothetical protein
MVNKDSVTINTGFYQTKAEFLVVEKMLYEFLKSSRKGRDDWVLRNF